MTLNRKTFIEWLDQNISKDTLIYGSSQQDQIFKIDQILRIINKNKLVLRASIVEEHYSKSVSLPVFLLETDKIKFFIRDNFYNIKCSINSEYECNIPLKDVHKLVSTIEFEKEIIKCADYSNMHVNELRKNDNWYRDWAGGKIIRQDGLIYFAESVNSCYCEGINKLKDDLSRITFETYEKDYQSDFTLNLYSYFKLGYIIELLLRQHD